MFAFKSFPMVPNFTVRQVGNRIQSYSTKHRNPEPKNKSNKKEKRKKKTNRPTDHDGPKRQGFEERRPSFR